MSEEEFDENAIDSLRFEKYFDSLDEALQGVMDYSVGDNEKIDSVSIASPRDYNEVKDKWRASITIQKEDINKQGWTGKENW